MTSWSMTVPPRLVVFGSGRGFLQFFFFFFFTFMFLTLFLSLTVVIARHSQS